MKGEVRSWWLEGVGFRPLDAIERLLQVLEHY